VLRRTAERLTRRDRHRYNCLFSGLRRHWAHGAWGRLRFEVRMSVLLSRYRGALGLLLLGTAFLTLWQLGRLPLLDVDEPVYGEVGRQMAATHALSRWLTPHYNGLLWFDKPPFFYWLTGLSMRLFGANEFAARLPSALGAVGLVAIVSVLARRMYPQRANAGLWAGFVLATGVQFFLLARAAVTDMTLALTLTLALASLYAWLDKGGQTRVIVLCGVWTGLACLVKGPVALVLIGAQLLLYLALTRRWALAAKPALWGGLALCLLVALPWYIAMIRWHGQAFVQGFLEANNVTRFLKPEHHETNSPFWYVPIFLAFFLPWTVAVPGALIAARGRNREEKPRPEASRPTLFLALWCALIFVFFSLSQTKLVTYIFPLFPAMAVLVGVWIAEGVDERQSLWHRLEWVYAGLFVLLAAALMIVGRQYHVASITWIGWLFVLVTAALACVLLPDVRVRRLAPGLGVALTLLLAWLSPTWNTRAGELSEREPARIAATHAPPGQALYAMALKHPSLVYYSGRRVVLIDNRRVAIADMASHPDHVYVMKVRDFNDMRARYHWSAYHLLFQSRTTCVMTGIPVPS